MNSVPYTERRNVLTMNIDTNTPEGIVDVLHQCNMQIFSGYEEQKGLSDDEFLKKLDQLVLLVKTILQNDKGIIVISGCGTSGRIGFLACTFFNQLCAQQNLPPKYRYLVSGGNSALVTSIEACEDDPVAGAFELQTVSQSYEQVLFIGITCGVSAPYVGGQLEYCLDNLQKYTPVLIGFNPVSMARKLQIPKWSNNRTFYDIATRMEATSQAVILNPIVGPEPISGSSRMKGGTATKIILDTVFYLALSNSCTKKASEIIGEFRNSIDRMESARQDLATVVQQAGESLLKGAYVRYLGSSTFGIWGMIDASECVPTYNSNYNDIRGFMTNDYFKKNLKSDLPNTFVAPVLDESTPNDLWELLKDLPTSSLVIFIDTDYHSRKALVEKLYEKNHQIVWIKLLSTQSFDSTSNVKIIDFSSCIPSTDSTLRYCLAETILKLGLNTISTGAHILRGKIYQNIMIDVRVSNIKLFYRAIDILKSLTGVNQQRAEKCLLHSIYQTDEDMSSQTVEQHIATVALNHDHIVPIALLMCLSNCSYAQAKVQIAKCPRICDICTRSS